MFRARLSQLSEPSVPDRVELNSGGDEGRLAGARHTPHNRASRAIKVKIAVSGERVSGEVEHSVQRRSFKSVSVWRELPKLCNVLENTDSMRVVEVG